MKLIRYIASWFDVGAEKYAAGGYYPVTDETKQHVAQGVAEVVDAPEDADKAEAVADKAEAKLADAEASAAAAREAAEAAAAAQAIADAAAPTA